MYVYINKERAKEREREELDLRKLMRRYRNDKLAA